MEPSSSHLTTRVTLTRELNHLKSSLANLGKDCLQMIALATSSLLLQSDFLEGKSAEFNLKICSLADSIESHCFTIMSLQQPLLKDLRLVIGVLRISNQLIEISDYSHRLICIASSIPGREAFLPELITILENSQAILKDSLKAFASGSASLAYDLVKKERESLNLLQDTAFQKIIHRIICENKELIETDVQVLSLMKLLERISDSISTIAKEVYFVYTGRKLFFSQ